MPSRYGSNMYGPDVTLEEKFPELRDEDPHDYARTIGDRDDMPTPSYRRKRRYGGVGGGKKWKKARSRRRG